MPRAKKSALQSVLRRRRIRRRRYKTHECDFNFIPCRAKISRLATTKNRRETRSGSTRASGFRSFYIIQGSISPACLRKDFTPTYPKCTKRQSSCQCICLLSGSLRAKAACKLRPCVRRKFPNFSFLRVLEMFGFRSSEFFRN